MMLANLPSIPTPVVYEAISLLCFVGEEIGDDLDISEAILETAMDGGFDLSFDAYEPRSHAIHASIPAGQTESALHELCQALDLLVN